MVERRNQLYKICHDLVRIWSIYIYRQAHGNMVSCGVLIAAEMKKSLSFREFLLPVSKLRLEDFGY